MDSNVRVTDYGRLRNDIRKILEQEYRPGDRIPSERQLAANFRVSPATIARALNDLARAGIVKRVRGSGTYVCDPIDKAQSFPPSTAVISRDAVQPAPLTDGALTLAGRTVGIVLTDGDLIALRRDPDLIYHRILSTIEREVQFAGGQTLILEPRSDSTRGDIDVLVLIELDPTASPRMIAGASPRDRASADELPIVLALNGGHNYWPNDCVRIDDAWGAFDATNHLMDYGHRRLAFLSTPPGAMVWGDARAAAFQRAIELRNAKQTAQSIGATIAMGAECCRPDGGLETEAAGVSLCKKFLEFKGITGVVVANDAIALAFMREVESAGVSIPADLSVVGYDNNLSAARAGLTTLDVPAEQLGSQVVKLCSRLISDPSHLTRTEIVIRPTLLMRSSVRAI